VYWGSEGILDLALDGDVISFTPRPLYPQGKKAEEAEWGPQPVWTQW